MRRAWSCHPLALSRFQNKNTSFERKKKEAHFQRSIFSHKLYCLFCFEYMLQWLYGFENVSLGGDEHKPSFITWGNFFSVGCYHNSLPKTTPKYLNCSSRNLWIPVVDNVLKLFSHQSLLN